MDADTLLQQLFEEQDDEAEEELRAQGALLAVLLAADRVKRDEQNDHRRRRYRFLLRRELLPDPREGTPWQRLWESRSDRSFITTMGVDIRTFELLLTHFAPLWNSTPIPREDVNTEGRPRLGRRSLDAAGGLGLALHFLSSAVLETTLQLIFALVPSVADRYIHFARHILLHVVREIPEGAISMPSTYAECEELSNLVFERHPALWGAIGTGDGLDLPACEAQDPEIENATYNGWKASHCIKNILFWSPKGEIIAAAFGNPGSWHDSLVAAPLYPKLHALPPGFFIVCDTAFPRDESIRGRIMVPSKAGERLPSDPVERDEKMRLDRQLVSFRQTAEWGMRIVQGSFGRMRVPLKGGVTESDKLDRNELLELCFRLTNVRARCVEINEIRDVYYPIWRAAEDTQLWDNLEDMMFSDIRRRDRVARFHLVAVQH